MRTPKNFLEEINGSLIFQIHSIHNAMFRLANQMIDYAHLPMKMEQLPVFMAIYVHPQSSQQEIANFVQRDKSSVLRTIATMEKKGIVQITTDKTDSRKRAVSLTQEGAYISDQLAHLIIKIEKEISGAISDRPKKELMAELRRATLRLEDLTNNNQN